MASPEQGTTYPPFWPEKSKSVKYGPVFTIDHVSHQHYQNIRSWVFKITKKILFPQRSQLGTYDTGKHIVSLTELMAGIKAEPKSCHLFQLMCWPQGHKVPTSTNALVELMNMVERWRQRTGYGPVVVVSPDGMSRAGVYCAANACIEQVVQHGEVDVFQAVHTVRRHRPQLIGNMTWPYLRCWLARDGYLTLLRPSVGQSISSNSVVLSLTENTCASRGRVRPTAVFILSPLTPWQSDGAGTPPRECERHPDSVVLVFLGMCMQMLLTANRVSSSSAQ
ncbi:Receptor-type tyrosine-protein phosphatase U [Portunus trituberculatus]|uniref:protein-tyrosine-phosphatase n=1 Tax=Portunus trituberculatus TaxID=210409 RepID=A0A5B7D2N6_PORTR|nr:Receptor-type tyrosine-protein phosphatase U [Portunus trituberculatus]